MSALLLRILPYILGAAVLLAAYAAWAYHERELGRAEIIAKDAKAVADQALKDKALSEMIVTNLQKQLSEREATVQPVKERIIRVATECSKATGPDAAAGAAWVRDALSQTSGQAARPKPAP